MRKLKIKSMIEADKEDDDIGCDQLFNCREVMLVNIFRLTPTKSEVIGFHNDLDWDNCFQFGFG